MNKLKVIFSACLVVIMTACSNKSDNTESTMGRNNDVCLNAIFPKGEKIGNNNFEGVAYLQWLMNDTENFDCMFISPQKYTGISIQKYTILI